MTLPLTTARLVLRELEHRDVDFLLDLLHEPLWLRFIGNKSVHDRGGAISYVERARAMQKARGHGLWHVSLAADGTPLGLCGLIKRDELDDVDLGFGFFERHHRRGYAQEAAEAVLAYGRDVLGVKRVVGVASPDNAASCALLEKLGFRCEGEREWKVGDRVMLYRLDY